MSVAAMKWAWGASAGSSTNKLVLVALADHIGPDGHCWPSVSRLCAMTELAERTVRGALSDLRCRGLIVGHEREGSSTLYAIRGDETSQATPAPPAPPPCTTCTPPLHVVQGTPARGAGRTVKNHKRTTTEPSSPPKPAVAGGTKGFAEFWTLYPRKVGKRAAELAWPRAVQRAGSPREIIDAARLTEWDDRDGGRYIPHPSTWLNRDGWLDGIDLPQTVNGH